MKRTKDMTSAVIVKPVILQESGSYLQEAKETWSKLSLADKRRLSNILGLDNVLRIEKLTTI